MDERPDALLKSALEKIVYFEARSEQLINDLKGSRSEIERLKVDLAGAAQREIELRRKIAELEVRANRAHAEREELTRLNEALRAERADLLGKVLEASRIHGSDRSSDRSSEEAFNLATFIAQLRSEALAAQAPAVVAAGARGRTAGVTAAVTDESTAPMARRLGGDGPPVSVGGARPVEVTKSTGPATLGASSPSATRPATAAFASRSTPPTAPSAPSPVSAAPPPVLAEHDDVTPAAPQRALESLALHAERLLAEGRLDVSTEELSRMCEEPSFRGRTEETLFGFSVRELAAPDPEARIRAAERLRALAHKAAAPALAAALHAENEPTVQVALLASFGTLARAEGVPIVTPLLQSSVADVRIAALKTLIALDASQSGPHLAAAMKDPDRAVRRRASLLALGLSDEAALRLGQEAIRDPDSEVRSLAALVLGASGGGHARLMLLDALRDRDRKVRSSAAQSLSRLLGQDVSAVVGMDDAQRRREVRRIATLPVASRASPRVAPATPVITGDIPPAPSPPEAEPVRAVVRPRPTTRAPRAVSESLCSSLAIEIRTAIRGRTVAELAATANVDLPTAQEACQLLVARGQLVRRGAKFFAA